MGSAQEKLATDHVGILREVYQKKQELLAARKAIEWARLFNLRIETIGWAIDAVLNERPKKMGRHAREQERDIQFASDFDRWAKAEFAHASGLTWTDAFEKAGADVHASSEAVRKSHAKIKKALTSGN